MRRRRRRQYKPVSRNVRVARLLATALKRAGGDKETLRNWIGELVDGAINKPCPYCLRALTLDIMGLDHKTPLSRGGQNEKENLQAVCKRCNQAKGSFKADEFHRLVDACEGMDLYMRQYLYTRLMAATRVFRRWRR